jgi:GT2 family glycosyltransferase
MNNHFAVGIPTYNQAEILIPTLEKYIVDMPNTMIYVLDNGNQNIHFSHPNVCIINATKNLGVAASWNFLLDTIFVKCKTALILNDDIYLGINEKAVLTIINNIMYNTKPFNNDFVVSQIGYCAFILPSKTYNKVGRFDEIFYPAYFEDCDYTHRLNLGGCKTAKISILNPKIYRQSQTTIKEPSLLKSKKNLELYIKKWGGEPTKETFKTPYNK